MGSEKNSVKLEKQKVGHEIRTGCLWIVSLMTVLNIIALSFMANSFFQVNIDLTDLRQQSTTDVIAYQTLIAQEREVVELTQAAIIVPQINDPYYYGAANPDFYPFLIYSQEPAIDDIPTLQDLSLEARSDDEVVSNFVRFVEENRNRLMNQFEESNPDRLVALVAMYIVHISHRYGFDETMAEVRSLLAYSVSTRPSQCRLQSMFQAELVDGLGLEWRLINIGPTHGWLEVKIDGHWELFDATANVWVDAGIDQLIQGESRNYRRFYNMALDEATPAGRHYATEMQFTHFKTIPGNQDLILFHGGPAFFRSLTPGLGIYYPSPIVCESNVSLCVVTVTNEDTGVTSTSYDEFRIASPQ